MTFLPFRPSPVSPDPSVAYTARLESELQALPLLVSHRSQADASEWYETRPYRGLSEDRKANSFTAGALRGPGKLAFAPLIRVRRDEKESLIFVHVGKGLCGHDGIVHGGLLATLLDEGMGRTVNCQRRPYFWPELKRLVTVSWLLGDQQPTWQDRFHRQSHPQLSRAHQSRPSMFCFYFMQSFLMASLLINFRSFSIQFIVLKTMLAELQGRKVWVEGLVQDSHGTVLADAKWVLSASSPRPQPSSALSILTIPLHRTMWIEPKYSGLMDTKSLSQAMGEREPLPEPWVP